MKRQLVPLSLPMNYSLLVYYLCAFYRYHARQGQERSGAYLFLPDREAETVTWDSAPIRIVEGPLFSQVHLHLPGVQHTVTLVNTPGVYTVFELIETYPVTDSMDKRPP